MRAAAEQVMERFGTELTIHHGSETKTLRGFFRAVNSQSWQSQGELAGFPGPAPQFWL